MQKTKQYSLALFLGLSCTIFSMGPAARADVLLPPATGVYHGAFPDYPEYPASVYAERLSSFEALVGTKAMWVEVPNDWTDGLSFPGDAVNQIANSGRVPYIRVLPRSQRVQGQGADPIVTLNRLALGDFDPGIRDWADQARIANVPLLVDFAPEANGRWYSWNGQYIGGPQVYQQAYRHFVDVVRGQGVTNITWFFHIDSQPQPVQDWNRMAAYYPGDDYVDWIGISVFGAQLPWDYWEDFSDILDRAYTEFESISATKPLAVVEWGVTEDYNTPGRKATWLNRALTSIKIGRYPRVKAISYWHEGPWADAQNLRLDSSGDSLSTYQWLIADPFFVTDAVFAGAASNRRVSRR